MTTNQSLSPAERNTMLLADLTFAALAKPPIHECAIDQGDCGPCESCDKEDCQLHPESDGFTDPAEEERAEQEACDRAVESVSTVRTLKQWTSTSLDLNHFLSIGDAVDDDIYDNMLGAVPPETHRSTLMQVGEPYSHVDGAETYTTFVKRGANWIYAGHCHSGQDHEPGLPVRTLYCACCAGSCRCRQWHNQDTGYGICASCIARIRTHRPFGHEPMTEDEIRRTYGIEGIHYSLPAEAPHPTPATREQADQTSNWQPLINLVGEREASNYMLMGNVEGLMLYKHCDNRQYLNIDRTTGQTFKFVGADRTYIPIDRDSALAIVGITVLRG